MLAGWPTLLAAAAPHPALPVTLRLDRNYYTSETVGRLRVERCAPSEALRVTYSVRAVNHPAPLRGGTFDIPTGGRHQRIVDFDVANLPNGRYGLAVQLADSHDKTLGELRRTFAKRPTAAHEVKFISCIVVHQDKVLYGNFRSGGSGYFDATTGQFAALGIPGKAEMCYALAIQGDHLWAATPTVRGPGLIRMDKLPWGV